MPIDKASIKRAHRPIIKALRKAKVMSCLHDMTDDFYDLRKPRWAFQRCYLCKEIIGKWLLSDPDWQDIILELYGPGKSKSKRSVNSMPVCDRFIQWSP